MAEMEAVTNPKSTLITVGDELLIGQTVDTNSVWMAQELNALGIEVVRRIAVGDDRDQILDVVDDSLKRSDLVIITGGLGPTEDDITKEVLADYFNSPLVRHEGVARQIEAYYRQRGLPMLDRNRRQADIPDRAQALPNPLGSAPGMLFILENSWLISLPGVPDEMKEIMKGSVIPLLHKEWAGGVYEHASIVTAGIGESYLAERVVDLESALPAQIRLAYLPSPGMVRLRLSAKGKDKAAVIRELGDHQKRFADRLSDVLVSQKDLPMEEILSEVLRRIGKSIGLAESCTGGNIAHLLTQIPGSGQYFRGSIVCYQNDIKTDSLGVNPASIETFGPVSEPVAREMALGACRALKSDWGFGITGLLDPDTPQGDVPGGRVWMAFAEEEGDIVTQSYQLNYDRIRNKEVAVQLALLFIWKNIHRR